MKLTYGNCHAAAEDGADVVLTDEVVVARATGERAQIADAAVDPDLGERWNRELWALAYDWFRVGGEDLTMVDGISAGDIGGAEVAQTLLLPAARAVLGAGRVAARLAPDEAGSAVAPIGGRLYRRIEALQCDAFEAAVRAHVPSASLVARRSAADERDQRLVTKYAQVRDPDWLAPLPRGRLLGARVANAAINARAALTRRSGRRVLVYEYNPTRALALSLLAEPRPGFRMVRYGYSGPDIVPSLRAGVQSMLLVGAPARLEDAAMRTRVERALKLDGPQERLTIDGVPLGPVLAPELAQLAERYAALVASAAPRLRRALERARVEAVVVPFDSPPLARLLVRVAQTMDIPTLVLANGLMADDFQAECMTADWGLAWSEAIAERYFARRPQGRTVVTGNPKAESLRAGRTVQARSELKRILIGSFTYSPADVNCRRSDSERFLEDVLEGVRASDAGRAAAVTVKLHPADRVDHYADVLSRYADLAVEVVAAGDVVELFDRADAYITTYSTSLVEAAALGLPIVYYRVNRQRLHPPFSDDPMLERRTAESPDEVAKLLDTLARDEVLRETAPLVEFADRYLGPPGGSVERITAAVARATESARP